MIVDLEHGCERLRMTRSEFRAGLSVAVLAALVALPAGGCRQEGIEPVPGVMLSAGLLVKTESISLSPFVQLRRYELRQSTLSNDFYPFNLGETAKVDTLVPKLYAWNGLGWDLVDFAYMPRAQIMDAPNLGHRNDVIVYMRPDVVPGEGDYPRFAAPNLRSYRVVICHVDDKKKYVLDCYTDVYGLGMGSFWRKDNEQVAFTTVCAKTTPHTRQLVVLDGGGNVVLDGSILPGLIDLEFISWSPDGQRLAALRPREPHTRGHGGGTLVEIDIERHLVRDIEEISGTAVLKSPDRFEDLIEWDQGHCRLRK